MKKQLISAAALAVVLGFCVNNVYADTYNFADDWIDWPGYNSGITADEYGTPKIDSMDVTVEGNFLMGVTINLRSNQRQIYDSLFINTSYDGNGATDGTNWDQWDYLVRDGFTASGGHAGNTTGSEAADGMWTVADDYSYTMTTGSSVRVDNPNGIDSGDLTVSGMDFDVIFDTSTYTLSYTFHDGLALDGGFFVAYAPWCANDVIGGGATAPVPEPATMLLFGTGLAGLVTVSRRRRKRQ